MLRISQVSCLDFLVIPVTAWKNPSHALHQFYQWVLPYPRQDITGRFSGASSSLHLQILFKLCHDLGERWCENVIHTVFFAFHLHHVKKIIGTPGLKGTLPKKMSEPRVTVVMGISYIDNTWTVGIPVRLFALNLGNMWLNKGSKIRKKKHFFKNLEPLLLFSILFT